jgi:hypothetical protein
LVAISGLDELLLLLLVSEVALFLVAVVGGINESYRGVLREEEGGLAQLEALHWLCVFMLRFWSVGKVQMVTVADQGAV